MWNAALTESRGMAPADIRALSRTTTVTWSSVHVVHIGASLSRWRLYFRNTGDEIVRIDPQGTLRWQRKSVEIVKSVQRYISHTPLSTDKIPRLWRT
jgi:hypothetical protein